MEQKYANHRRYDPPYHFVLSLLTVIFVVGSIINAVMAIDREENVFVSLLLIAAALILTIVFLKLRSYPMKTQDRVIRAEENLRHYVLAGKLLDPALGIHQITALRFAGDAEFPELARRAAAEHMKPDAIKQAIRQWRPDHHRI